MHRVEPSFARLHPLECRLPAILELGSDQTVVRIARGIAPLGQRGLVAGFLQIQFGHALAFTHFFLVHSLSLHRGFDRHGLRDTSDLLGDGSVHANTAKCLAALKPELDSLLIAAIHRTAVLPS